MILIFEVEGCDGVCYSSVLVVLVCVYVGGVMMFVVCCGLWVVFNGVDLYSGMNVFWYVVVLYVYDGWFFGLVMLFGLYLNVLCVLVLGEVDCVVIDCVMFVYVCDVLFDLLMDIWIIGMMVFVLGLLFVVLWVVLVDM